jgi:hypothetical protein
MAKSKKKHRSSSRKFKELEGHIDDLGAEVIQIERSYLPHTYSHQRVTIAKLLLQGPTRQKSAREDTTMIQRMEVYLNHPELPERGVVLATTCRTQWASPVARMSKYTYRS